MEFIQNYWQFLLAGVIVLAIIIYWAVEVTIARKEKEKELENLEKMIEDKENSEKKVEPKKEEAEVQEKEEDTKEADLGTYMVSYDKVKKDWVVKRRGSQRASKRTATKQEAMDVVKKLTKTQDVGFTVKKKNGKFQKK